MYAPRGNLLSAYNAFLLSYREYVRWVGGICNLHHLLATNASLVCDAVSEGACKITFRH